MGIEELGDRERNAKERREHTDKGKGGKGERRCVGVDVNLKRWSVRRNKDRYGGG